MQFLRILYVEEGNATLISSWVNEQQHLFVTNILLIHFHMMD